MLGNVRTYRRQYQCLKLNELEDEVAVHASRLQLTILVTCRLTTALTVRGHASEVRGHGSQPASSDRYMSTTVTQSPSQQTSVNDRQHNLAGPPLTFFFLLLLARLHIV